MEVIPGGQIGTSELLGSGEQQRPELAMKGSCVYACPSGQGGERPPSRSGCGGEKRGCVESLWGLATDGRGEAGCSATTGRASSMNRPEISKGSEGWTCSWVPKSQVRTTGAHHCELIN